MDSYENNIVEQREAATPVNEKRSVGFKIHFIVDVIFAALATVAFVVYLIFAIDFITMVMNAPVDGDFGTQLGHGIGIAVAIVLIIIIGIISVILSLATGIISGVGIGIQRGAFRIVCIALAAVAVIYILSAVITFIFCLRFNEVMREIENSAALMSPSYL